MDIKEYTNPHTLEYYSFAWSEVRLIVAAVSLIAGATPIIFTFVGGALSVFVFSLLKICWIISGAASAYLLYRWSVTGKKVFGGTDKKDMIAFFVSVVSGLNLGVTGIMGKNFGMLILQLNIVYALAGIAYLVCAWHLFTRWKAYGQKLF